MGKHQRQLSALSELINAMHLAAQGRYPWQSVAESVRAFIGVDVANLLTIDPRQHITGGICAGMSDAEIAYYTRHWTYADDLAAIAFSAPTGRALRFRDLMTTHQLRQTDAFQGWYEPMGYIHDAFLYFPAGNGCYVGLSVFRDRLGGPVTDAELANLDLVGRHFCTAVATAALVDASLADGNDTEALLGRWGVSLVGCDASARVKTMRGSAERFLRRHNRAIGIAGGRLRATDPTANRRLVAAIANPEATNGEGPPAVGFRDEARRERLCALVLGLRPRRNDCLPIRGLDDSDERLVLMHETEAPPRIDTRHLATALALTPAEADVLARLMVGDSVDSIADARGSTFETIRSYLKGLRRKLNAHSQAQLVAAGWRAVAPNAA